MLAIFCTRIVLFILLPITAMSAIAVHIGTTQPMHPALRGFVEGCENIPQPCWYGIDFGRTRLTEALTQFEALGFEIWHDERLRERNIYYVEAGGCTFVFNAEHPHDRIYEIEARSCEDLRLGDMITELGEPRIANLYDCMDRNLYLVFPFIIIVPYVSDVPILTMQLPVYNFRVGESRFEDVSVPLETIKPPYRRSRELSLAAPRKCG